MPLPQWFTTSYLRYSSPCNNREYDRFEIGLPVKFVPDEHDAEMEQMILIQAEYKKRFMVSRFKDGHIQLMAFPYARYLDLKYYDGAYYNITDPAAEKNSGNFWIFTAKMKIKYLCRPG